ncbi:MAG: RecX family transcriptional regulator [Ktedonobacteraceae bacterium]|nr:RecX family transcriptional regulator [Ktedonobacteraceae bacterium]
MRITALQPQANNAERVNVFVDGQFLLAVHALLIYELDLQVEQELTDGQLARLRYEEELQQAVDRALRFLAVRPRSRAEVRRYLHRKGTTAELIETAIERLEQLKLLDDRDFASFWVETRERASPRGALALRNELRLKGVQRDVVEEVVSDEQDDERALQAARKKAIMLTGQPGMDYATFQRRLGSFLRRRGFGYNIASRTVRTLWNELREEDVDPL